MKRIPLTKGKYALVDDVEYEDVSQYNWCYSGKYAQRRVNNKNVYMHRYLMQASGRKQQVDHVNGNPLDNTRANLRLCTQTQNSQNMHKPRSSSGFKGVCWASDRDKWRAKIKFDGKVYTLGSYDTKEEAAKAYDEAAIRLFGQFACPNFKETA